MHDNVEKKERSNLQRVIQRLTRRNVARLSLFILLVTVVCALFPNLIAPKDPYEQDLSRRLMLPTGFERSIPGFYLGTDQLGRDILSRLILGARITLIITVTAVFVSALIGISAGLLSGYFGGKIDLIINRIIDIQLAFPIILLVIAVVAVVGPSLLNLVIIMGISGWPRFARITRASVLSVKEMEYVDAARSMGASTFRIITHHILLNILSPLIVYATFDLARIILMEAVLSFLGLGVQPPTPTWGGMINDGKQYIYLSWAVSVIPGIVIVLITLAFNMLGDELRDALDPHTIED